MKRYQVRSEVDHKKLKWDKITVIVCFCIFIIPVSIGIVFEIFSLNYDALTLYSVAFMNAFILYIFWRLYVLNRNVICRTVVFDNAVCVYDYKERMIHSYNYADVRKVRCIISEGYTHSRVPIKYSHKLICLVFNQNINLPAKTNYDFLNKYEDNIVCFVYTDEAWQDMINIFGNIVVR